jgi:hypothetical protein
VAVALSRLENSFDAMNTDKRFWIGADPGGRDAFRVAILFQDGSTQSFCLNCADEAIVEVRQIQGLPSGAGIDAPPWWSSGPSSDRLADQWIRSRYGLSGGNVQAANSLRGAGLVQGAMFAARLREFFPKIKITECHPKAVWVALEQTDWNEYCKSSGIVTNITGAQEHERDAILAAVAAREGFSGNWPRDLSHQRLRSEQDPATYWLSPIHYFRPE